MITLTATRRLSRFLRTAHEQSQARDGAVAWSTPDVWPLNDWLRERWLDSWPTEIVLTATQEQLLWEECLAAHRLPGNQEAHARRAQSAHALLSEWQLNVVTLGDPAALPRETKAFLAWRRRFLDALAENRWIDSVGVLDAALRHFALGQSRSVDDTEIDFRGFDEVTPRLAALEAALTRFGARVSWSRGATNARAAEAPQVVHFVADDPDDEVRSIARWCRERATSDPTATIGVVVPQLERRRGAFDRALREELTPASVLRPATLHPTLPTTQPSTLGEPAPSEPSALPLLHSISLAPSFVEQPIIATALRALEFAYPADFADVVSLLRSPFLRGAELECSKRAAIEVELRRARRVRVTEAHCIDVSSNAAGALQIWKELGQTHQAPPDEGRAAAAHPSVWCQRFRARLAAVGWPGERTLSSDEAQTVDRFERLLDELAGADLLGLEWDGGEARRRLREAAARVQFQPRPTPTPGLRSEPIVQVLGVLEAGGLSFDHLWLAGMTDEVWPPRGAPHPLLPLAWQRDAQLPHSSPRRVARFARALTGRLLESGQEIVVSRPRQVDGRETIPADLVARVLYAPGSSPLSDPGNAASTAPSARYVDELLRNRAEWEFVPDEAPPPLPAGTVVRGGVAVLADQAACPFRAFALHRLAARPLEVPDERIDPRERGELLHRALEHFWSEWHDHATLTARSAEERHDAIVTAVSRAAGEFLVGRDDLPDVFRSLEVRRAEEIVTAWLEQEERREPFRVEQLERAVELDVSGVLLRARIDRVDVATTGGEVVIDYKTGRSPNDSAWEGARPDQPQLPVYATFGALGSSRDWVGEAPPDAAPPRDEQPQAPDGDRRDASGTKPQVSGLAFGALARNQLRFYGCTAAPPLFPRIVRVHSEDTWKERLTGWRTALERLAESFRSGAAVVDPKHVRKSCQRCHLHAVCRIAERDVHFVPDEELFVEPETGLVPDRLPRTEVTVVRPKGKERSKGTQRSKGTLAKGRKSGKAGPPGSSDASGDSSGGDRSRS